MAALKKRYYQKIDEEVYSAILDSGMSLSIFKKKGFVEKAAFLSTNFGALDNHFYIDGELQSYPAGIAHFLEHKLFEDEQGRDVTLDFVKLGADVNAFTTLEKTTYYFSTLDHFEESLELLLKFTSSFTSSEDAVNHEKRIIEQEIRRCVHDFAQLSRTGKLPFPIRRCLGIRCTRAVAGADSECENSAFKDDKPSTVLGNDGR